MRRIELLDVNKTKGYFHEFGVTSTELDVGGLNDSVAIIELEDGFVTTTEIGSFKFLDKPELTTSQK